MNKVIIVAGATASGKSKFAVEIALKFKSAVVINADSLQVYQEVPILTAQPTVDDMCGVPHEMYGFVSHGNSMNAYIWASRAASEIQRALDSEIQPIVVGGSGMYINALIYGFSKMPKIDDNIRREAVRMGSEEYEKMCKIVYENDPNVLKIIAPENHRQMSRAYEILVQTGRSIIFYLNQPREKFLKNVDFQTHIIDIERSELYERINQRFRVMVEKGAIDEVRNLINITGKDLEYPAFQAIGVREIMMYLDGKINYDAMIDLATQKSRNYAKRQITWFKKYR